MMVAIVKRSVLTFAFTFIIVGALSVNLAALALQFLPGSMEADRLFTYAFLDDVFFHGGVMSSWNFGQHSDWFPDKILAAIAFLFTRKIELWYQIYTALMIALCFGSAWYFFTISGAALRSKANSLPLLLAFLTTGLSLVAWHNGLFNRFLVDISYPSHHYAASLAAVVGALAAIDALGTSGRELRLRIAAASIILFLVTVSDKIAVPIVLPSFAAAMIYNIAVTRKVSRGLVASSSGVLISVAGAYVLGDRINSIFAQVSHLPIGLKPGTIPMQTAIVFGEFFAPSVRLQFLFAVILATSVLLLLSFNFANAFLIYCRKISPLDLPAAKRNTFFVYLASTVILHPLAMIAVGGIWVPELMREIVTVFFCSLWVTVGQLDRFPLNSVPTWITVAIGAALGIVITIPVFDIKARPWRIDSRVGMLECLQHYEGTENLRRGLGYHWDTTPAMLFSNRKFVILNVNADAKIWHWVNNLDWYAPTPDNEPFTFIVLDPAIDHQAIQDKFGPPEKILQCSAEQGNKTLWLFDRLSAERLTNSITDQYWQLKRNK